MDKIGQLLERGFLGGIVMAAAFVGFSVFLYLVYRLIKFLQPKTVRQEEQRVYSHPFYKVSGRGRKIFLPGNGYCGNYGQLRTVQKGIGLEPG